MAPGHILYKQAPEQGVENDHDLVDSLPVIELIVIDSHVTETRPKPKRKSTGHPQEQGKQNTQQYKCRVRYQYVDPQRHLLGGFFSALSPCVSYDKVAIYQMAKNDSRIKQNPREEYRDKHYLQQCQG